MLIENMTFVELPTTAYWYAGGNNMNSPMMAYWVRYAYWYAEKR
jgi:hypothetical protein